MKENSQSNYHTLWQWSVCLFGKLWTNENFPTVQAIRQSALCLTEKYNKLKKLPHTESKVKVIADFLNTAYLLPRTLPVRCDSHQAIRQSPHVRPALTVSSSSSVTFSSSSECSSCAEKDALTKEAGIASC